MDLKFMTSAHIPRASVMYIMSMDLPDPPGQFGVEVPPGCLSRHPALPDKNVKTASIVRGSVPAAGHIQTSGYRLGGDAIL
jgi:hypothetical protein